MVSTVCYWNRCSRYVVPPEKIEDYCHGMPMQRTARRFLRSLRMTHSNEPMLQMIFSALQRDFGLDFRHYKPVLCSGDCIVDPFSLTALVLRSMRYHINQRSRTSSSLWWSFDWSDSFLSRSRNVRIAPSWNRWTTGHYMERRSHSHLGMWMLNWRGSLYDSDDPARFGREEDRSCSVKIFATDIDRTTLDTAARGLYSDDSIQNVPEGFISRYFKESIHGFQIVPEIRQMITFAPHNVLRDAPFTIWVWLPAAIFLSILNSDAQQKVLSLLYFGWNQWSVVLGSSETPGEIAGDVRVLDNNAKIFFKNRLQLTYISHTNLRWICWEVWFRPSVHHSKLFAWDDHSGTTECLWFATCGVYVRGPPRESGRIDCSGIRDGEDICESRQDVCPRNLQILLTKTCSLPSLGWFIVCENFLTCWDRTIENQNRTEDEYVRVIATLLTPKSGQIFTLIRFETLVHLSRRRFDLWRRTIRYSTAQPKSVDELSVELSFTREI